MGSDVFRRRMLEATIENRREAAAIKRRIAALYEQAAEDMASKAASSKAGGLTEAFARSLSHSLRERCHELWREVGEATKAGMATRAERMVGVQTAFLNDAARRAELDLKPTLQRVFGSVSDDAVRHVLQGGIYGGQAPTLSKRIWNNAALQNGQIEQVIAGALAKKQSAVQLAKSLEAYLNPGIVQPDNWNDIYPDMPFVYKVDYNAKRLAVTSINHAGWAATISAARSNPYADYLHWELTPAHVINDVCDGYAAHDEGMGEGNWSLDAAPLPHPFCTCLWYADTNKTLEEIGRELKAWEEGESNPRLDKAFGDKRNNGNAVRLVKSLHEKVLAEYQSNAIPRHGKIIKQEGYQEELHRDEVKVAEWMLEKFGGTIELRKESTVDGVHTTDYFWNGVPWELKTLHSEKAANSAVRQALIQLEKTDGGIILDCAFSPIDVDMLMEYIERRLAWGSLQDTDIIIKENDEVINIVRYKKQSR